MSGLARSRFPDVALEQAATSIVRDAQRVAAESGRLCRLVERAPVLDYLRARRNGSGHREATRVSGLSFASVKRWIAWGRDGIAPYAGFVEVLQQIDAERQPVPVPALEIVPELPAVEHSLTPAVLPLVVFMPNGRALSPDHLRRFALRASMLQEHATRRGWELFVPRLWAGLQGEAATYGLQLPALEDAPEPLGMGTWQEVFDAAVSAAGVVCEGQPG